MNYLNHTTWWPPRTWSRSNSAPQLAKLQSIQAKVKHITYLTSDIVVDSVCEQWLAQKKREFLRDWTTTSDNCAKANQIPIPTHVTDTWWKWEFFFHKQSPFELSSHSFQVIMFHTQPIHSKFLESNPPWITGKKKKNIHDSSLTPENHPMSVRYETLVWSVVLSFRMGWHLPLFILKGTLKGTFASAKISALHAWLQPTRLSCLLPWL